MVGIRAATKCDTCRVRKRKCCGEKPACSECINSGWTCPGYRKEWKFMDETPRMKKLYSSRKFIYAYSESEAESEDENPSNRWRIVNPKHVRRRETVEVSRFNGFDLLGSTLVYCLSVRSKGALLHLGLVDMYFEFIPARLGTNLALDQSIRCLCVIYSTSNSMPLKLRRDVCQSYVKAIKALRDCINDPALRMEPETLCASLLLHLFELVIHDDDTKWDHLARGSARLLQARGVERYKTPFELAMLESQYGFLFRQTTKFNEPCFLKLPEWQAHIRETHFSSNQSTSRRWRSKLCGQLLVHFSTIKIDFLNVCKNSGMRTPEWEVQRNNLIDMCFSLLDEVKTWLVTDVDPVLVMGTEGIQYEDLVAGVVDCIAHIAVINCNRMLGALCFAFIGPKGPTLRQLEVRGQLDYPDLVSRRLLRAEKAAEFVKGESIQAGKALDYGLENARRSGMLPSGVS